MAVLIEGISVVIRAAALATAYSGGASAFNRDVPPTSTTYCTDGELIRQGFTNPNDVRSFVEGLEGKGLRYVDDNGAAVTVVVVDQQRGLLAVCSWATFGHAQVDSDATHIVAICQANPTGATGLALPANWTWDTSLTNHFRFVPSEDMLRTMEFLRHENGVDVYRDRAT